MKAKPSLGYISVFIFLRSYVLSIDYLSTVKKDYGWLIVINLEGQGVGIKQTKKLLKITTF
jgi:hypothetical protein